MREVFVMRHFSFDEFGSAFNRLPRHLDDLREREIDGSFLPGKNPLASVMIGVAIWVLVLAIDEMGSNANGRLAAVSASLASQSDAGQLAHHH
jgi:hypothetical protein